MSGGSEGDRSGGDLRSIQEGVEKKRLLDIRCLINQVPAEFKSFRYLGSPALPP